MVNEKIILNTLILLFGVSIIGTNAFLMSPILNDIGITLDASTSEVSRAVAAYGGTTAFSGLFFTRFSAKYEYHRSLIFSGLVLALGILITGLSNSWEMLVISQGVAGLGAGVMLPTIYSMVAVIAPKGKESTILGYIITGWSLSMVIAVPISAFISDLWGWRYAYFIISAITTIILIGFNKLPKVSQTNDSETITLIKVLRIKCAKLILSICFMYMVSFYGVYTFIGKFVQVELNTSVSQSGLVVLAYGAGFGIGSIVGKVIDRISPLIAIKYILFLLSGVYFLLLVVSDSFLGIIFICFIWGMINHLGLNNLVSILSKIGKPCRVRMMGLFSAVSYGGTMVAAIIFGAIYEAYSFLHILSMAAILCATSAILCVLFLDNRSHN